MRRSSVILAMVALFALAGCAPALGLAYGMTITVEKIDATGAVLRFTPTTADRTAHVGSGSEGFSLYGSN